MARPALLAPVTLGAALPALPAWRVQSGALVRTLTFDGFMPGVKALALIGPLADALDHHPDVELGFGKLVLRLSTHDAGGITALDVELASQIDRALGG